MGPPGLAGSIFVLAMRAFTEAASGQLNPSSRVSHPQDLSYSMHKPVIRVILLYCFLLCGCDSASQISEYDVKRESGKVQTSDVLRDQFEAIPFRWKVPADWREAQNDQFSSFAWRAGPKDAEARITITDSPAGAGIEPQFIRWQGQLNIPETESAKLLSSVEELDLGKVKGRWIEIKGDSETILGMVAPYKDKLWIFKFRSSNATAADQREAFRAFCESLNVS
jgi:hypothetical protein